MWRRRLLLGGAAALLVTGVGLALAVRWVDGKARSTLTRLAEQCGLSVRCEDVQVRWVGARLTGVHFELPQTDSALSASFEAIEVDTSWLGVPEAVRVLGGRVEARGALETLRARLRAERTGEPRAAQGSGLALELRDVAIEWQHEGGRVLAQNVSALRRETWQLSAQEITVSHELGGLEVRGAHAELDEQHDLSRLMVRELGLTRHEEKSALLAPEGGAVAPASTASPWQWPQPSRWREGINATALKLSERLAARAEVSVAALRVDFGEHARFGPAPLRVSRQPATEAERAALVIELLQNEPVGPGAVPLSFSLRVPDGGDPTLRFEGGPIGLSALGVFDGQLALTRTQGSSVRGRGSLLLGASVEIDASLQLEHLFVEHPRLAKAPLEDLAPGIDLRATLDHEHLQVESMALRLGALNVRGRGELVRQGEELTGQGRLEVAEVGCEALHQSIPEALVPRLRDFRFDGSFSFLAEVQFDSQKLDDLSLEVRQRGVCRATAVPAWATRSHFSGQFSHIVYDPEGKPREALTGPGSPHYSSLDDISEAMQIAVLTSEDGGFFHHHGWSKNAIRRALIANLKAKRFVQGASTISMQLAKNLFLSREKTLSRKLEELVLTDYLEQTFDKHELMELYLNIIELGPDIYGVTDAARYYFGREPAELNLAESMFLASLMPAPVRRSRQREKGELVGASRAVVDVLLRAATRVGRISELQREIGLTQPIVFHTRGPRPPPRGRSGVELHSADDDDEP